MNNKNKYHRFINSVAFQQMDKEYIVHSLEDYADNNIQTISTKDYNNIFRLYSIKEEYIKREIIKRLSQKTILKALT